MLIFTLFCIHIQENISSTIINKTSIYHFASSMLMLKNCRNLAFPKIHQNGINKKIMETSNLNNILDIRDGIIDLR